jgi:hypothetical protein
MDGLSGDGVVVHKASLLDIPFIFELLLEGAFIGSFSSSFMLPNGSVKLLFFSFKLWLNQFGWGRKSFHPKTLLMFTKDKKDVGFVYLESVIFGGQKTNYLILSIMSISKSFRSKKIGTNFIENLYQCIPPGSVIAVSCTKYSVVMQKILRKLKFKVSKNRAVGLVEFTKTKLSV